MRSSIAPRSAAPERLTDSAYAAIKRSIIWCSFPPGTEITEGKLSEQLRLGKAPIRTALAHLAQEGLVEALPRRGYRVSPITLRDVREVFEARILLEAHATRKAAGKLDSQRLAKLEKVVREAYIPGDRASEARFLNANRRFHLTVAEAGANGRILKMIAALLDESERILHLGLGIRDRSSQFQHEHRELVAALQKGDSDRAAKLTIDALTGGLEMVVEGLLEKSALVDAPINEVAASSHGRR